MGVDCVEIGDISVFSTFGVKLVVFSHVSRAGMLMEDANKSGEVTDGVVEERTKIFGEFLLIE